ncbi:inositol monophosphatase family protein [Paracoccus litorisediminis]|uniref:inositol monophosphatase family protein n=1 Tax=Paracoccus litorisediminis TaxID=2006130 RepID=UPI003731E50B
MKKFHEKTVGQLLIEAERSVIRAGSMIRGEFHRPYGPRASVDKTVEEMLREELLALCPGGWIGEETGRSNETAEHVWIVDPNDGTRDFLKGLRGSAISVALLCDARPVLAIVHAPVAPDDAGDLISWAEGQPVRRNGRAVVPKAPSTPRVAAMSACAADYAESHPESFGNLRIRAMPSPVYRLALVAVGEVDVAISTMGGLAPWDIAGGQVLLAAAGKGFCDLQGRAVAIGQGANGCIGGDLELVGHLSGGLRLGGLSVPRRPARPRRPCPNAGRLSRAQGCLLGQLAGDALGSMVEFQSEARIAKSYPQGVRELRDGGTWNLIAGQPTDDSEMALALARSLVAEGGFDRSRVGHAYVVWGRSGPFDIGGTTRAGLAAIEAGAVAWRDSQANGALMRVAPIGIYAVGDPVEAARLARLDAELTHPHPVCLAANAAYAAAISAGIAGASREEMVTVALAEAGKGRGASIARDVIEAARHRNVHEFQHQMGWVLIALQNAFHHLLSGLPLAEAVAQTVSRGGDTDTNAAICGALLGACEGREAVPQQWRRAILTCRPVASPGIHHPRPRTYWPDDALELAEALLTTRDE